MNAPLQWHQIGSPVHQNFRAQDEHGTLCLDHPDDQGFVGLRYEPTRPTDLDYVALVNTALCTSGDLTEPRRCQAMLGFLPRQGIFASTRYGQIALKVARHHSPNVDLTDRLSRLGFRPWPRDKRSGTVQGYRLKLKHRGKLTLLIGRDVVELSYRDKGGSPRKILMRLIQRSIAKDGRPQQFFWPPGMDVSTTGLAMALAVATAFKDDHQ